MTLIVGIHEAYVRGSIVGNENRSSEGLKFLLRTCTKGLHLNMLVGDPCQLGRKKRTKDDLIDKLVKLLNDIALVHLRSSDLDQVIING